MALSRRTLTTSPSSVYTSAGQSALTNVHFCNNSASATVIDVYLASAGSTANVSNIVYTQVSIPAYDTFVMDTEKIILDDGDILFATAGSSSAVVATVSYLRI
jgi:hypothetical protein